MNAKAAPDPRPLLCPDCGCAHLLLRDRIKSGRHETTLRECRHCGHLLRTRRRVDPEPEHN